jgi:hypothetical protein
LENDTDSMPSSIKHPKSHLSSKSKGSLRQRVKTISVLFQRKPLQRQVSFYGAAPIRTFRVRYLSHIIIFSFIYREPTFRSIRRSRNDIEGNWESPSFKPWVSPVLASGIDLDHEKPTEYVEESTGCSNWWETAILSNFVDQDYVQSQIDSGKYLNWISLKFASAKKGKIRSPKSPQCYYPPIFQKHFFLSPNIFLCDNFAQKEHSSCDRWIAWNCGSKWQ